MRKDHEHVGKDRHQRARCVAPYLADDPTELNTKEHMAII